MKFDKCEQCGGSVRSRKVTIDLRRGDRLCVFRNVPVGVCLKCGERYYPGPVLERLDALARYTADDARTIRVPQIDYAEAIA
jgi:YgiT-type zinc finger domain-containing protein